MLITQGFLRFVHVLDGILAQMRAANQLRPDLPVEAVRSALMGMFEGLLRDQMLAEKTGFPARYTAADLRQLFNVILPALASGKQ